MAVTTYTHGGTSNQPFAVSGSGVKFIDGFASSNFASAGPTDPYTGVQLYLVNQIVMIVGGQGAAGSMGLWNSAGSTYRYVAQTLNGVAATVSSATTTETATINAVIQSGKTYYAGVWANASLASKRDTATGSFSGYAGSRTSTTVGSTYNPGNLYFQIKYYQLPTAPSAVTVTSTTPTTASLSWTAPSSDGGTAVTAYKIQYSTDSGASWTTHPDFEGTYGVTTTSATLTGLTPGQTYSFRVSAKNGVVPGYGFNGTTGLGSSFTDDSAAWYYDGYSSGPYSTASSSVKLTGGLWSGVVGWVPFTAKAVIYPKTTVSSASWSAPAPFASPVTVTLSAGHGLVAGDYLSVQGSSGFPLGNGLFLISASTSTTVSISITSGTSSSSGTFSGVIVGYRPGHIKVYNGTGWTAFI